MDVLHLDDPEPGRLVSFLCFMSCSSVVNMPHPLLSLVLSQFVTARLVNLRLLEIPDAVAMLTSPVPIQNPSGPLADYHCSGVS